MSQRLTAYEKVHAVFGFLTEIHDVDQKALEDSCAKLADFYHSDFDLQELILECQHFKHHVNQNKQRTQAQKLTTTQLYDIIKSDGLESTFPDTEVALRIHLTLMPTNCTGERFFFKLNVITNHLRSCMLQPSFSALSIMSIKSDLLGQNGLF